MTKPEHFGWQGWALIVMLMLLSFCSTIYKYSEPNHPYWDEKFHVTSAQKYLNNHHFMQAHPPLGKMLIALGEIIVDANPPETDARFVDILLIGKHGPDFNMRGYRLIPMILAWLLTPITFIIFFLILRNRILAALLSFVIIFDTGQISLLKAAVLESPLIFSTAFAILAFLVIPKYVKNKWKFALWTFLLGTAMGAAFVTKLTGLFLILLAPLLLLHIWPNWKKWLIAFAFIFAGFAIVTVGIWQLHFSLGTNINPTLPMEGYHTNLHEYREILDQGKNPSLLMFPTILADSFKYMYRSHTNIGDLNLCTPDYGGSPWIFWPFGGKSIHFLSGRSKGGLGNYMYLQANPAVWWTATLSVFISIAMLLGFIFMGQKLRKPKLLISFLILYLGYMLAISQISRTMFLYHYFPPLYVSFILLALVINELKARGPFKGEVISLLCILLSSLMVLGYLIYRPMIDLTPMTDEQLKRRAFFPLWNVRCHNCKQDNLYYKEKWCNPS